ncbi:MAG: hypothetical protein WBK48_08575 [Dethiobacteria bacterium]|nr:hypothetical protein [Bacillota bacterium]HQD06134.1 hypothetical protein [Bacillota bacterium]
MRRFRKEANIKLEGCYTGKAAAASLDYCAAQAQRERPVIFIHTASTTHRESDPAAVEKLPHSFRWCFTGKPFRRPCHLKKLNRPFREIASRNKWRY